MSTNKFADDLANKIERLAGQVARFEGSVASVTGRRLQKDYVAVCAQAAKVVGATLPEFKETEKKVDGFTWQEFDTDRLVRLVRQQAA